MIDDEEFSYAFGALLRRHITRRGWTYDQVAFAVWGASGNKSNVSAYVNGRKGKPSARTIARFRDALNIPQTEIDNLGGVDQATVDVLVAREQENARVFGIKEGMLIALAQRYAEGSPRDFDAALAGLERALEVARDERKKGRLPSDVSDAVDAVISRIDALNEEGDLDAGQVALDAELARLDKEDQHRRAARMKLHEKGVAQAILTRNVGDACRHTVSIVNLKAPPRPSTHFDLLIDSFFGWYDTGLQRGLSFDVEVALSIGEVALSEAVGPVQCSIARNCLGFAHRTLGEREAVQEHLKKAIHQHRTVLAEMPPKEDPFVWATAQHGVGTALTALGERGGDQQIFKDAIVALRAALSVRTREQTPSSWAESMHVLGIAYASLADRGEGVGKLKEAISVYRAALEERTRAQAPNDWASTQTSLGNALLSLGRSLNDVSILEEAADAFNSALEIRTRQRRPLERASTQYNLGIALFTIGGLDCGSKRLSDSVVAYRSALKERTRERVPLDWANTLVGLGATLSRIGRLEADTNSLDEAAQCYRSALEEITVEQSPIDWAIATGNLATALAVLAQLTNDGKKIEEAIFEFQNARSVLKTNGYADYLMQIDDQIRGAEVVRSKITGKLGR